MSGGLPPVIRLGHDLVRNFEALPPHTAVGEVAAHIRRFWDPGMRRELLGYVDEGDPRVGPLLAAAAEHLRAGDAGHAQPGQPAGG